MLRRDPVSGLAEDGADAALAVGGLPNQNDGRAAAAGEVQPDPGRGGAGLRGRGVGQRILSALLARYEGRSLVLDMEDPAQPGAPNPGQRRRRAAFYRRNGFRETGVGRTFGPVAMTILLRGDDTFTQSDYSDLLSEIFRLWRPPKS